VAGELLGGRSTSHGHAEAQVTLHGARNLRQVFASWRSLHNGGVCTMRKVIRRTHPLSQCPLYFSCHWPTALRHTYESLYIGLTLRRGCVVN